MSEEHREDEEIGVESHVHRQGVSDVPAEDADDEIEAHVYKVSSVRMDSPSNT